MADTLKYGGPIRLAQLASDPSSPENGLMYYNTTSNKIRQYINGAFQDVASGDVLLTGKALNENEIIVGNASDLSAAVDTSASGDILADSSGGLNIKSGVIVNADINASAAIDATKIANGSVSNTEFQYLDGVTSAIQTQISAKIDSSEKGANNGVATLDAGGKVPVSQLPNSVMEYQGAWNANTNSPTLSDGTGNNGDVYRVSVAGTQDLGSGNITFAVADLVIYNGAEWEKAPAGDAVISVNGQQGAVVLDTDDISEGSTNLYFSNERAQDAVGNILTDSSSVDFTYNDAGNTITAAVLPAGVDHNSLQNYSANRHIDHSAVSIATGSNSGLTGGGDITTTRNLSVDINGTTAETSADNADAILIYDNSATSLRKMTRANFLSGIAISSAGDINESSFSGLSNNTADQVITGLAFNNAVVRSFKAQVSIVIDATTDLFAHYELMGVQRGSDWVMSEAFTGDSIPSLTFNITTAGQVRVTIGSVAGFSSGLIKFRAVTTSV